MIWVVRIIVCLLLIVLFNWLLQSFQAPSADQRRELPQRRQGGGGWGAEPEQDCNEDKEC